MANRGGTGTGGRDDPAHRATKAERKEQARLERERIQQQMRARHRNRNIGLTLMALAVVVVVVVVFVMQPGNSTSGPPIARGPPEPGQGRNADRRVHAPKDVGSLQP